MIKNNSRNKLSLKQLVSVFVGEGWGGGGSEGEAGGEGSPDALGFYRLPKHLTYVNYFDY